MNGNRKLGLALVVALASAGPAAAQISTFTAIKNGGNTANGSSGDGQVTSTVAVLSAAPDFARARYSAMVTADVGFSLFGGNSHTRTLSADWNVNFNVTAPGAYLLHVTGSLKGAFTTVDDGNGSVAGDISAVTGTQTGATFRPGCVDLNLSDPNFVNSASVNLPFNNTLNGATGCDLLKTSNGVSQAHALRFTWQGGCTSTGAGAFTSGGDECALRLGDTGTVGGISADDYPGVGSRVQAEDGQFVTVAYESLCGNLSIDGYAGEQCDQGFLNGTASSCCTSTCQLKPASTVCRAVAGICDVQEVCDGVLGFCPGNSFVAAGTPCRASAGACDLVENCTGASDQCPADAKSTAICRGAADLCDLAESCDGINDNCPADQPRANGALCRFQAGPCDTADFCDGVAFNCPDIIEPSTTECRPSFGVCDPAENCDGSNVACPADLKSVAQCRAAADICDVAEACDGVANDCPPDVFLGSAGPAILCRSTTGVCDPEENCDGTMAACPADVLSPIGTTCRAAAGVCDAVETCDGVSVNCPTDSALGAFTVCRPLAGNCDVIDNCDGVNVNCPADVVLPNTTNCRPSTNPACDFDEFCTGSSGVCPPDIGEPDTDLDTICDPADNCLTVANTDQLNGDGDTFGDACDDCNNILAVQTTKTKLKLAKLLVPAGDDTLVFKGAMIVPVAPAAPPLDLINKGARLILRDSTLAVVLDATIPAGLYDGLTRIGWTANFPSTAWKYTNKSANLTPVGGIYKISIKQKANPVGLVKFNIKGKRGSYSFPVANLPLSALLIIEGTAGLNNQCGDGLFPGPAPLPICSAAAGGVSVTCR